MAAPESQIDRIASHSDIESVKLMIASLRELLNERHLAHQREHELLQRIEEEQKLTMDRRLEHMNELREQVSKVEERCALKDTVEVRFRTIERQIWIATGAVGVVAALLRFWIK